MRYGMTRARGRAPHMRWAGLALLAAGVVLGTGQTGCRKPAKPDERANAKDDRVMTPPAPDKPAPDKPAPDKSAPDAPTSEYPAEAVARLRSAPLEIQLNGGRVVLETYLWRDFMPAVENTPTGRGMMGTVTLVCEDSKVAPAGVSIRRIHLLTVDEHWSCKPSVEARPSQPGRVERIFRDGPKWKPGTKVDVVIEIDGPGGREMLLRAANQTIHQTS